MIWLSLHPSPASEASAFNKIRAFSPLRRAASFPGQCRKLLTFFAAQPRNIFLYDNFPCSHDRLSRPVATKANHQILSKLVEAHY